MSEFVDLAEPTPEEGALYLWDDFVLWPKQWRTYADLHKWQIKKFKATNKKQIPVDAGIYTFLLQPRIANHRACSYLMYVGQASSLRGRFERYLRLQKEDRLTSRRPRMCDFLRKYDGYIWFYYTTEIRSTLTKVEKGLMHAYIPPLNEIFGGRLGKVVKIIR